MPNKVIDRVDKQIQKYFNAQQGRVVKFLLESLFDDPSAHIEITEDGIIYKPIEDNPELWRVIKMDQGILRVALEIAMSTAYPEGTKDIDRALKLLDKASADAAEKLDEVKKDREEQGPLRMLQLHKNTCKMKPNCNKVENNTKTIACKPWINGIEAETVQRIGQAVIGRLKVFGPMYYSSRRIKTLVARPGYIPKRATFTRTVSGGITTITKEQYVLIEESIQQPLIKDLLREVGVKNEHIEKLHRGYDKVKELQKVRQIKIDEGRFLPRPKTFKTEGQVERDRILKHAKLSYPDMRIDRLERMEKNAASIFSNPETSEKKARQDLKDAVKDRYGKWKFWRAQRIASVEHDNAYEAAKMNYVKLARSKRPEVTIAKYWKTRNDDRVDQVCINNQAAGWILFDQLFPSGHSRPLAHPKCRCSTIYKERPIEDPQEPKVPPVIPQQSEAQLEAHKKVTEAIAAEKVAKLELQSAKLAERKAQKTAKELQRPSLTGEERKQLARKLAESAGKANETTARSDAAAKRAADATAKARDAMITAEAARREKKVAAQAHETSKAIQVTKQQEARIEKARLVRDVRVAKQQEEKSIRRVKQQGELVQAAKREQQKKEQLATRATIERRSLARKENETERIKQRQVIKTKRQLEKKASERAKQARESVQKSIQKQREKKLLETKIRLKKTSTVKDRLAATAQKVDRTKQAQIVKAKKRLAEQAGETEKRAREAVRDARNKQRKKGKPVSKTTTAKDDLVRKTNETEALKQKQIIESRKRLAKQARETAKREKESLKKARLLRKEGFAAHRKEEERLRKQIADAAKVERDIAAKVRAAERQARLASTSAKETEAAHIKRQWTEATRREKESEARAHLSSRVDERTKREGLTPRANEDAERARIKREEKESVAIAKTEATKREKTASVRIRISEREAAAQIRRTAAEAKRTKKRAIKGFGSVTRASERAKAKAAKVEEKIALRALKKAEKDAARARIVAEKARVAVEKRMVAERKRIGKQGGVTSRQLQPGVTSPSVLASTFSTTNRRSKGSCATSCTTSRAFNCAGKKTARQTVW